MKRSSCRTLVSRKPPKSAATSAVMRANRSKNTGLELLVRRLLRDAGARGYRLHWRVIGRPDVAFPGRKIAVFAHGCYWHGHSCGVRMPGYNRDFWDEKIDANRRRDREVVETLERQGWSVVIIWECVLKRLGQEALSPTLRLLSLPIRK